MLTGERYKTITKETAGVLRGEYGATPAPVDAALQARVLEDDEEPIVCRPADRLENELDSLVEQFDALAREKGFRVAENRIDDVLTWALFPQVGLKFLEHHDDPSAFEPIPGSEPVPAAVTVPAASATGGPESYQVIVDGHAYSVTVGPDGGLDQVVPTNAAPAAGGNGAGQPVPSPLAGTIFKVKVAEGQVVRSGEVVMVLEAMKMETEVRSPADGTVCSVAVREGDAVQVGDTLLSLA